MTRKEAIRRVEFCRNFLADNYSDMGEPNFMAFNMAIEALEQESCDNILTLTERVVTQVTEDMNNFIFTTIMPWCEAKEQRIISKRDLEQALTQYFSKKPCDDAISRQAVLEIHSKYGEYMGATKFWEFRDNIRELPPIKPQEPKIGHWVKVIDESDNFGNETWHHKCSICGNEKSGWGNYKYCPDCGAKMVESEDKE